MLGEMLGEESGQVTGRRVLPVAGGPSPVVEASYEATGTLLGSPYTVMGTYTSMPRADGSLFGEGQGVLMTGDGLISWRGVGVGRFTASGGLSWRGGLVYETAVERYARLNGVAGVFEFEVGADGKTTGKIYEWK
jgi:hypothetical protein